MQVLHGLKRLWRIFGPTRNSTFPRPIRKDKDFYTNRCDGLDRQIDALVYDLYALTPAEIQIVEA
jgi:hypothetical protein